MRLLRLLLLFPLSFAGTLQAQADVDYLKSIDGEASSLSVDKATTRSASEPNPTRIFENEFEDNLGGARVGLTPGLSAERFEHVLKNNYIGSYLFYKRLSKEQKAQVYDFYQTTPDPAQVRNKILQVSKQ